MVAVGGNRNGGKWIRPHKRRAIYSRDGFACVYCSESVEIRATATLDHLVPRELGGTNHESNLVTCCFPCNCAKQDLSIRSWFVVLRDRGVDTDKVGPRIRRLTRKSLKR